MRYQWNIGYVKPLSKWGIKKTSLLRYTFEEKTENRQSNDVKLRITLEKDWFEDLAKSYIVLAYQNRNEKKPAGEGYNSEEISLEGALNFRIGSNNTINLSGKVAFWDKSGNFYGTDYSLSFLWQARFF
jgi:hypothetical protein